MVLQMVCTALNIAAGTATLTPKANVIQDTESRGVTAVAITANANSLPRREWTVGGVYDVTIEKAFT